jgi:hypothetical protein
MKVRALTTRHTPPKGGHDLLLKCAGLVDDVPVAVWIGYERADGKRRTLGGLERRQAGVDVLSRVM